MTIVSTAWAAGPAATTPGGAMPHLDEQAEPFVYPNVTSAEPAQTIVLPDPEAPRMSLRGFDIRGVVEHPEHGITLERIEQLISRETDSMLPPGSERLFSIAMFEKIALSITRYYRQRGYFLARTFIPEQTVNDDIVRIDIVESSLDQVFFEDNTLYSDRQLAKPFAPLIDQPVVKDQIEAVLFDINDFPGLGANAVFGPGTRPGTAAIVVQTREQKTAGRVSFDNYGSAFTGENRLWLNYDVNNFFHQADVLSFNVLATLSPQNSTYGDVSYAQPVYNRKIHVGGGIKLNLFDVGQELADLGINGQTLVINGFGEYRFFRTRTGQLKAGVDVSLKSATSKVVSTVDSEDKLTVIRFDVNYSGVDSWLWHARHQASASLSIGLADFLGAMDSNGSGISGRRGGSGARAGGDFSKLQLNYTRVEVTDNLQSILFRAKVQFSSDLLTSLEQVSLGGPDSVRAYPVADSLMDNTFFTSVEWIVRASPAFPQTWLNKLQLSAFFDYATGSINDPLKNDVSSVTLGAIGVSAQVEPFNHFSARIDLATAVAADKPSDEQSLPFYFRLGYAF